MKTKRVVIYCVKCGTHTECEDTKQCPQCGSLNITKTKTKPLNIPKNK